MSTSHTSWQGRATQSNQKEQKRVASKYKGVKKIARGDADIDADPFYDNDPVLDDMAVDRKHDPKEYARAAALPLKRAKQILKEAEK